jgi:hypothetical protein
VLRVPQDHSTIQGAVDAASPGDTVLVDEGTYAEAVTISTNGLVLRGVDRNLVILDGEDRLANGVSVTADGVAVENLTVRRYQQNGVLFTGGTEDDGSVEPGTPYGSGDDALVGYRAAYITAHNNGLYGVYAFAARDGVIEHTYASGHPDSGIYVGQCRPCNVVIRDSTAELNAIGYYGTNASGGVFVIDSVFRRNRLGLTPNSQDTELLAPQEETVVAGNLVVDNAAADAPPKKPRSIGGGIAIGGGSANVVLRNRVSGHPGFGIGVVALGPYEPGANRIEGNVLTANAIDLLYLPGAGVVTTLGNCFVDNDFTTSSPDGIEAAMPCSGDDTAVTVDAVTLPEAPPRVDYRDVPFPGPQSTMPDPLAPAAAVTGAPVVDLDAVSLPEVPR